MVTRRIANHILCIGSIYPLKLQTRLGSDAKPYTLLPCADDLSSC